MTAKYLVSVRAGRATGWSMVWSVLMIVVGVLAIGVPFVAGVAVTGLVGWLLVLSGMLHLALAWRGAHATMIWWEILLGIVYGLIGFYVIGHPITGLAGLTLAVSAYLLIEGVLEFVLFFRLRPESGAGWLLVDAVLTVVLAVMIATTWPFSATWVVGTLVGISMLFSGIARLFVSRTMWRVVA